MCTSAAACAAPAPEHGVDASTTSPTALASAAESASAGGWSLGPEGALLAKLGSPGPHATCRTVKRPTGEVTLIVDRPGQQDEWGAAADQRWWRLTRRFLACQAPDCETNRVLEQSWDESHHERATYRLERDTRDRVVSVSYEVAPGSEPDARDGSLLELTGEVPSGWSRGFDLPAARIHPYAQLVPWVLLDEARLDPMPARGQGPGVLWVRRGMSAFRTVFRDGRVVGWSHDGGQGGTGCAYKWRGDHLEEWGCATFSDSDEGPDFFFSPKLESAEVRVVVRRNTRSVITGFEVTSHGLSEVTRYDVELDPAGRVRQVVSRGVSPASSLRIERDDQGREVRRVAVWQGETILDDVTTYGCPQLIPIEPPPLIPTSE